MHCKKSRKSPPAADVVDQYGLKTGGRELHIVGKGLQGAATFQVEAALARIFIGPDDAHAMRLCIVGNGRGLALGRVALVLGGHAHILGNQDVPIERLHGVGHNVMRKHC